MPENSDKPDKMNVFLKDVSGIIKTPGQTLGRLMEEKNWVPMFRIFNDRNGNNGVPYLSDSNAEDG